MRADVSQAYRRRLGDDIVVGGRRTDYIIGSRGADKLTGGGGADVFIYGDAGDSTPDAANRDLITDFSHDSRDMIDFSDASAGELDFMGKDQFSYTDQIRYEMVGKNTFVYINLDDDIDAEMAIKFTGKIKFSELDFDL